MKKIAILGLGEMGVRMAARLIAAEHDVVVYNRSAGRSNTLAGATARATPREAAQDADIVISMVTDDTASRAVWLDEKNGALRGIGQGALAIESSTVTPAWIDELSRLVRAHGCELLDAPVLGSRPQAEAGALIYLMGGSAGAVERARPIVMAMGSALHHVGPIGAGVTMKLAVNALFGVQVAALAEVVGLLENAGFQRGAALDVLAAMPVTSPALHGIGALVAARRYQPMFPIDLVEKDFRYALDTARVCRSEAPVIAAARTVYAQARERGLGGHNIAAVAKLYERAQ